jgi:N-acetylmuramoyl-L-alanine amidase-like protein
MSVVNTLKNRGFSVQFVIDRGGSIWRVIPEGQQASHTKPGGTGTIGAAGRGLGNQNLEGVEVIALNDKDVTPEQRAAVGRLVGGGRASLVTTPRPMSMVTVS